MKYLERLSLRFSRPTKALNKKAAEKMGHIKWVEGDTLDTCLQDLGQSAQVEYQQEGFNGGIWVKKTDLLGADARRIISGYIKNKQIYFDLDPLSKTPKHFGNLDKVSVHTNLLFSKGMMTDTEHQAFEALQNYIDLMTVKITELFPEYSLGLNVYNNTTEGAYKTNLLSKKWGLHVHADGNKNASNSFRFFETIAGPRTLIVPNKDRDANNDFEPVGKHSFLYEAPQDSIIAISSLSHDAPLAHCFGRESFFNTVLRKEEPRLSVSWALRHKDYSL